MGNVIPWSQIHPSITSEEPFVAVVIIDPQRQICVSEMVAFEPEALTSADVASAELIAAAQAAATKVASGYRVRRKQTAPSPTLTRKPRGQNPGGLTLPLPLEGESENPGGLRVLKGGKG
jgi:hypothetical protein